MKLRIVKKSDTLYVVQAKDWYSLGIWNYCFSYNNLKDAEKDIEEAIVQFSKGTIVKEFDI